MAGKADRDEFTAKVKETLAKRVGSRCSNPGCRQATSGPTQEPTGTINVGVAAHITAAAPGGARYDGTLTAEQRRGAANGIWLCGRCEKLIDRDEARYTVDVLRGWKRRAESEAQAALDRPSASPSSPRVALSDAATELLLTAARDRRGIVRWIRAETKTIITTNGRDFVKRGDPRSEAKWIGALRELSAGGLLVAYSREVYNVTREGFDVAERLEEQTDDT